MLRGCRLNIREDGGQDMSSIISYTKVFAVSTLIFLSSFLVATAQPGSIYTLPVGKRIRVKMDTEINSRAASVNDTFFVTIAEAVSNRGAVVIPLGTRIDGRVEKASPAGFGNADGRLEVIFDRLRLNLDSALPIEGRLVKPLRAPSRGVFAFLLIAGSAAAGAIIGSVADIENGTAIGAAIGAGAGAGGVLIKKGRDVRIRTDEVFEIELKKELVLPAREF